MLFTEPGERVNQPEFGCGLFNLVFDPANTILAAAIEFTVGAALTRWLGDQIVVNAVNVTAVDETVTVEVAYISGADLTRRPFASASAEDRYGRTYVQDGNPVVDYMARDYDSLLQAMCNLIPSKLPEWTDFNNEADFGNVLLEMFALHGRHPQLLPGPRGQRELPGHRADPAQHDPAPAADRLPARPPCPPPPAST